MSIDEQEDLTIYEVVVNIEEQYSIWPAHKEPPLGWRLDSSMPLCIPLVFATSPK